MDGITFSIQRDRLIRYWEVTCLIAGLGVAGWVLLKLGLRKTIQKWAKSLEYRLDENSLSVSSCFVVWGWMVYRREQRIVLPKITDVKLVQGPILGVMGLWALRIQTAGRGHWWPEATLYGLENPHGVRDQILAAS